MSTPTTKSRDARVLYVVLALVLLPLVVTLISLIGAHWHPSGDTALEVLRIRNVGSRHTPLTGVQSRFGWDHPGPAMFWLLAPFHWMLGDTGILFGVGVINGAALVATVLLAWRRGGAPLTVIVGIGALLLERAFGSNLLIDPWNPWLAAVPFLAFVMFAWSIAERDYGMAPWAVGVGSFLVQTHVGYAPVVLGIGAIAIVLAFFGPRVDSPEHAWTLTRGVIVAAIVGVVVWLPPIVQELTGNPRNLSAIVSYFRHPAEPAQGFAFGFGLMGKELGGAWLTGNDSGQITAATTASTIPALILLAVLTSFGIVAWRRGSGAVARLALLLVASAGVGVIAGARITGLPGVYLVRWWWVLGALIWCSLAWSVWTLLAATRPARVIALVGVAAVAILSISGAAFAVPARVPTEGVSIAMKHLLPPVVAQLHHGDTYLVTFADARELGAAGNALYLALDEHGFKVKVERPYGQAYGSWRVANAGDIDGTVTLGANDDIARGFAPPPGAREVAHYDPLSPAQRARATQLAQRIRARVGDANWTEIAPDWTYGQRQLLAHGANPADVAELHKLRAPGSAYTVWINGPAP
jgi:hypothetical protein